MLLIGALQVCAQRDEFLWGYCVFGPAGSMFYLFQVHTLDYLAKWLNLLKWVILHETGMTYLFLTTVLFEELMELLGKIEGLVNDIHVGRCGSWT